jgi:hypothetical protein
MKIPRVFSGADGQSHFDEVEIELDSQIGQFEWASQLLAGPGVIFRETGGDYSLDFHTAPRRQFVVNLDGWVELEVGDGTMRRFGPGAILFADDLTGQGHKSRAVNGQPRSSLVIPIEEELADG